MLAQDIFVLQKHGRHLRQAIADISPRFFQRLFIGPAHTMFQHAYVRKQLFFKIEQKKAYPRPVHRIARHKLRMGETLINIFIDDI